MRPFIIAATALTLPLGGCLATKIVTVPAGLAVDAVQATGKGVMYVGGTAVRVTGDALDGPDEMVRLKVTYKKGKGTRTRERTVKAKYVEREIKDMSKDGKVLDVEVSSLD
ncbi:MAG: hypothetical protein FP825_12685 [Hyphomonas sp.]|uniref:hypothetical protein n=1 Tax=Hyphomonas sp. TaxID=87 RepID=UPI0017B23CF9|nr:hypothetical protein [Hyphomonas sp.]MBU3921918.1 hypothetical protein [Alphaproteobacteria bacterium]MBA3069319.1 hypothetical protein [Hyphomonas sp.]MBU4063701.1 hypothetical protein [Alphaproteobacteria bacterium]MBU4164338.1 hypothetical protein [Alphaproteobacteria bacterium]MBU4569210.1 hypothetical protein [Alphaproteobacteria bacterium]